MHWELIAKLIIDASVVHHCPIDEVSSQQGMGWPNSL